MAVSRELGEISRVFVNYRQLTHISRRFARFTRVTACTCTCTYMYYMYMYMHTHTYVYTYM